MWKLIGKIFIALILLAVVIGISFYRAEMTAHKETEQLEKIKEEYFNTRDSVYLAQLDDSTRFYIDSIMRLDSFYSAVIDSLNEQYQIVDSLLLAEMARKAEENEPKKEPEKPKIDPVIEKVKGDYRSMRRDLPGDLTSYEKRIAFNEIYIKLSRKYSLSPDSVKKIIN